MTVSTPAVLTERFRKKPLDFNPGTKWAYSNSGYVLLGRIVERVSGEKLAEFLDQNIFKPLGLVATGQDSNTEIVLRRAAGYVRTSTGLKNARFIELSNRYAAGDLCSTTDDLMRWQLGIFGGHVLSSASLEKMITPVMNNYAMGLFVTKNGDKKVISHSGGIAGFNTYMSYHPNAKISVIVLGNENGAAPEKIGRLLDVVAEGGTVQLPSERVEIVVPAEVLQRYVGTYRLADGWKFAVTREGDRLFLQGQGQAKGQIFPESETKFFRKSSDAEFEFTCDSTYAVTGVILHQDGDFKGVPDR